MCMLHLRKSKDRGYADHGWLKSFHTFSFADYRDTNHMNFRTLRVINEDFIRAQTGFGEHPHRDMEIISYVIQGSLSHKDSMGNESTIRPGEVQRMSAGVGVVHSEQNNASEETHLLQIWIMPNAKGGAPGYGQKSFESELNSKDLVLVVSKDGRDGSIAIKQDADLYISRLKKSHEISFVLKPKRGAWVQLVKGKLAVNNLELLPGDGLSVEDESLLKIKAIEPSEFLLFDLL